jgi:hypothetical protein
MPRSEKVLDLNVEWAPDVGAPEPMLWQNDDRAVLIFTTRAGTGLLVEFGGCLISQFGYPNDEALAGHPLYRMGLREYGFFEVADSSWLDRLNAQNRIAFPSGSLGQLRHFVVTLHDSTFECLAQTLEAKDVDGPPATLLEPYLRKEQ